MIVQDSPISLQATRGARKPNLQVTVTHARHVGSRVDLHQEWMECIERFLITRVLIFYFVAQIGARAFWPSISPVPLNPLVITGLFLCYGMNYVGF